MKSTMQYPIKGLVSCTCGGPPQVSGSIYYPKYTVHCLKCGKSTSHHKSRDTAVSEWNSNNKDNN